MAEYKAKQNLSSIKIGLASPEKIRSWSKGEVTKPETINYRSQRPEMDGLFCERIFGPAKDWECHCGRYKKVKFQGTVCEKCGVEVTTKDVRRERMGHIELAAPCSHIWYLKGIPSRMAILLDIPVKQLEEIVYYGAWICLNPGKSTLLRRKQFVNEKIGKQDFVAVLKEILEKFIDDASSYDYSIVSDFIEKLENPKIQEFDFYSIAHFIKKYTGATFSEGGAAVQELLRDIDIEEEIRVINKELKTATSQKQIKLMKRLEILKHFQNSGNKPEWMILNVIPVIPPDLRPMLPLDGGRFATSDLNDLYRRVITRNNRLKHQKEINAPGIIIKNESRMLQEAVDALIDNGRRNGKPVLGASQRPLKSLSGILKGKQGRFRQNLLGKRVDYSGRSVIAIGPELRIYQCGLPREMAALLLRPFITHELVKDGYASTSRQADQMIDRMDSEVFDELEKIIDKHPVLLNRAPTLHRLGIQAFQAKLVDGKAIRLHPLVCTGFNADFDGDQMGVHVPLSKEAQEEAINLMLASNNILSPKDGKAIVAPSQDIIIGNYYLTIEGDKKYFLERADQLEKEGDISESLLYRGYADAEGKVFKDVNEVLSAYAQNKVHIHNRIAIIGKALKKDTFTNEMNESYLLTTVGKIIFNTIFPSDFPYLNEPDVLNLKGDLIKFFAPKGTNIKELIAATPLKRPFVKKFFVSLIDDIFHTYGTTRTAVVVDKIKDQGFYYSTQSGVTVAISDIEISSTKRALIEDAEKKVAVVKSKFKKGLLSEKERFESVVAIWKSVDEQVEHDVTAELSKHPHNPLFIMFDSGARGSKSHFKQLMGMRGLMANTQGKTIEIPITSCFREGLNVSEFFIGTHGARKGGADTALKTSESGYLTRRLVDVAQDVIVREADCHTDHGSTISTIVSETEGTVVTNLYDRLIGRYALHDVVHPESGQVLCEGNELIDEAIAKSIVDAGITHVTIRSLLGCETKDGVCIKCYGRNLANGKVVEIGEAVGVMAAQSIGEPGTQLTMRTFHTGGVATGSDITRGLPRIQELFEARNSKSEALISEISGTVESIENKEGRYTITVTNDLESKVRETVYDAKLTVKVGDVVKNGDKLTAGSIPPKELLKVSDVAAVEKYIVDEVHAVYQAQGIFISDKHIEVIIRQMLRRIYVVDPGDTNLLPGVKTHINEFTAQNEIALLEGKRPAVGRPVILGITKAALEVDSFLSAASFQETTKVLTDAAIRGKIDRLHGLKENVITGRLIPAGRGLASWQQEQERIADFDVTTSIKSIRDQYHGVHDVLSLDEIVPEVEEVVEQVEEL